MQAERSKRTIVPRQTGKRLRGNSRGAAAIALCMAVTATPSAVAQQYNARIVSGWQVGEASGNHACYMGLEYEGRGTTSIILALDVDNRAMLTLSNDDWPFKTHEELSFDFELSNGVYSNHPALGNNETRRGGFLAFFEPKFTQHFGESTFLRVQRNGESVVQLKLFGTRAAIAQVKRCVSAVKARVSPDAREAEE